MKKSWVFAMLVLSLLMIAGCSNVKDTESLNQVSLLQWLTLWDYY